MSELRKLTWKYFWQQKAKEMIIALLILVAVIFIPYFVGTLFPDYALLTTTQSSQCFINRQVDCGSGFWEHWITGLFPLAFGGLFLGLIIKGIVILIKSNWRKAERRAEDELRKVNEAIADLNQELLI